MMMSITTSSVHVPRAAWILGGTAAAIVGWPLALSAAGWTAGGVTAGSVAAGIQAGIGNVVAGSTFAIAQSAAMGGTAAGMVNGVLGAVGAVSGAMVYGKDSNVCKEEGEKSNEEKTE